MASRQISDIRNIVREASWFEQFFTPPADRMTMAQFSPPRPEAALPAYDIVAIASSAGGIAALELLLSRLDAGFPAALVIVQHLDPRHRSLMADILNRHTSLTVKQAQEGDRLEAGNVYVASPNRHLLARPDRTLTMTDTELVHFVRPSADLLFESVAASFKERAIAVVLTGTGSDGAMGVGAIKKMGGTVIAQDEKSSEFTGMPNAAIATGNVDFILPLG